MNARYGVIIAAALLALASCGASAPPAPTRPDVDYPMSNVISVCDRFGTRVYVYDGYKAGGLAVVPQDPSCKR